MNPHTPLLLRLIYAKADVRRLILGGLTYSQISVLISSAIDTGLVEEFNDELKITTAGMDIIKEKNRSGRPPRSDGGWIGALDEFRVDKVSAADVYLSQDAVFLADSRRAD